MKAKKTAKPKKDMKNGVPQPQQQGQARPTAAVRTAAATKSSSCCG